MSPPSALRVLKSFEGTCVELSFNPHEKTYRMAITEHTPEDLADNEHRRHNAPSAVAEASITAEELPSFVPGKRYLVTIVCADDL